MKFELSDKVGWYLEREWTDELEELRKGKISIGEFIQRYKKEWKQGRPRLRPIKDVATNTTWIVDYRGKRKGHI